MRQKARFVKENANVYFKTKEEYLNHIDSIYFDREAVIYNEDGTVTLDV